MDFLTDRLSEQYGSFPEAVIFLYAGQILYSNEAGQALLKKEDFPQDLLPALAEHPGGMEIALGKTFYFVTVSQLQEGDLLVLRDLDPPPEKSILFPMPSIVCASACQTFPRPSGKCSRSWRTTACWTVWSRTWPTRTAWSFRCSA